MGGAESVSRRGCRVVARVGRRSSPPSSASTANLASLRSALGALRENRQLTETHVNTFTDYLWFNTKKRQEFVRITDEVAAIVKKSGIREGMVLVSAMHITSGVYVNDWENGLIEDFQVWLEKLAPAGLPYKHHQTGEDNADAHLKRTIMGHQVICRSPTARSISAHGSRCSTRSSMAGERNASS